MTGIQHMMIGAGVGESVVINNYTISHLVSSGSIARSYYRLTNGGLAQHKVGSGAYITYSGEWLPNPRTISAGEFESRATLISGPAPLEGEINVWEDLSTSRHWQNANGVSGTEDVIVLLIEIRQIGSTSNSDTATITLRSEVGSSGGGP